MNTIECCWPDCARFLNTPYWVALVDFLIAGGWSSLGGVIATYRPLDELLENVHKNGANQVRPLRSSVFL